ncbi:MAG: PucR family transcriptional regulator [Actinomycetes bacterium]
MTTVQDLAAVVGPALLDVVAGEARRRVLDVSLVAAGDPDATAAPESGDLVLCAPGARDAAVVAALLTGWGHLGVAAVALPRDVTDQPAVRAAARQAGVCLLAVPPGTAWAQLVWVLIGLLEADPDRGAPDATGFGELFTLADAVEALLGGPVTIEDAASRVLAHSAGQHGADPARLSTIVGRRVPAELTERFRSMGVLRALQTSDEPVLVPSWGEGISPRLVLPVRAGKELLGSIWAVVDDPVPPRDAAELQRVVSLVALQLLRRRAHEDLAARLESDRLLQALSGQPPAGWSPAGTGPWRVVCLAEPGSPDAGQADRWRAVLRWNGWRTPALTEADGSVFAVVDAGPAGRAGSWAWLARTTTAGLVGASGPLTAPEVADPARLVAARVEAAEVTELLRSGRLGATSRVRAAEEAWAALVVARAVAAVGAPHRGGPVDRVLELDRHEGTDFARTLSAALAHPGDPRAAAARLHVHPNTFRYRMRRLRQAVSLDLDDDTVRLALGLQLRAAGTGGRRVAGPGSG